MNYFEFTKKFPTEQSIIDYFIKIRYPNGLYCPHCGAIEKVYHQNAYPKNGHCNNCNNEFSIFSNTIFEKSSTDLRKWFYAINLMNISRKGISALQLQREIGVTYKTAWRMLKQIRTAMGNIDTSKMFEVIVEIDETYVGGKPRKENNHKKDDDNNTPSMPKNKRGRGTKKTPVVGIVARNSKMVFAKVMHPNKKGKVLSSKQLYPVLDMICCDNTIVITDEFRGYNFLDHKNKNNFVRLKIDHSVAYADGDKHTNNIESFWALLKRGIHRIYHHVSVKHMQTYLNEFCFRINNRHKSCFDNLLKQCILT